MSEIERCCGTCEYGSYSKTDGYVCTNNESEYVADYTEYSHSCENWERKEERRSKQ